MFVFFLNFCSTYVWERKFTTDYGPFSLHDAYVNDILCVNFVFVFCFEGKNTD